MTGTPQTRADADGLDALAAQWAALTTHWDVDRARLCAEALDALVDLAQGTHAERGADFGAYLAAFADGSLLPNRAQLARLDALARAFLGEHAPAQAATPLAPVLSLPATDAASARPVEARSTVCLLGIGEASIPGLADMLGERGYHARHFADIDGLAGYLADARPGAVIIDSMRLRGLPRLKSELGERAPGAPLGPVLIVASSGRDLSQRLLAMRAGAAAFFSAPLDAYRIVSRLEELLGRHEATPYRVLIVDGDREAASQHGRWLVEQGMTARLAFDGQATVAALAEFRPDLVLIDAELPDARGHELAQMVRQQAEYASVPVVLAAHADDEAQRFDAIAAGADEVLVKPLKPRHLIATIRSRVQRAQWLRGQSSYAANRDARTGLHVRQHLIERLQDTELGGGTALLFVGLDRAERLREAIGLGGLAQFEAEVAQAFRESLSTGDIAAPLRDFAYAVIATREHRDQLTELAERLRLKLSERRAGGGEGALPVAASIGITVLDDGGAGVDARVARAEAASMAAARVGGDRVLWYEPSEYALVRPDPALAVRAVLSRPWNEASARIEFRPLVPLAGKLTGQFDLLYPLVSTLEPGARADYAIYAPIAAELGALAAIERRRIAAALDARESRLKLGRQVRLFLPLVAATLLAPGFVDELVAMLRERRLSGTGLCIELPSRDLIDHREALATVLATLRQAGVRIGITDYGRDWAAVHVLSTLAVDFLRLDRELVKLTSTDKAVSSTLLALVRKGHQLGAQVIAPDVESIERAHVLLRLGIDYGSGDGLGRAQAEPEFDFNRPIW
jgi:PleD family two-component response regulator/EAL domain-containing protein (putative c-di-GMP-specific phosphodiesterase class I)